MLEQSRCAAEPIDRAEADLERAIAGSDVRNFFATPVGCILSQFETIAPLVPSETLITDAGSTKQQFVERARWFTDRKRPPACCPVTPWPARNIAESRTPTPACSARRVAHHAASNPKRLRPIASRRWLRSAREHRRAPRTIDAERHDRLCAWVSHLPQMISTAFATVLRDELGDDEAVVQVGGRALREMTRIAHSPYSMWRDIALTKARTSKRYCCASSSS